MTDRLIRITTALAVATVAAVAAVISYRHAYFSELKMVVLWAVCLRC
jgi:hypothetical protein